MNIGRGLLFKALRTISTSIFFKKKAALEGGF